MILTAHHPDHDTVLYDGHCRFCLAQIAMLRRLDLGGRLRFTSLHDPSVSRDFPEIPFADLMDRMFVIDRAGKARDGADAVRYLSRRLVPLWPLGAVLHIPGTLPLWQRLYAWIAARRYGLAGRCSDEGCRVG
ncbi:MAG: thiol-disulfide oxidoreductase DCC family protein [Planctomycetia bacterium]|jgi:predicted DCC family thiol-disulfide oxidoreductase YuxK